MMTDKRAIMEAIIYQRYKRNLESAAEKINNGWNESGIEHEVVAAEKRLQEDLKVLDRILKHVNAEES